MNLIKDKHNNTCVWVIDYRSKLYTCVYIHLCKVIRLSLLLNDYNLHGTKYLHGFFKLQYHQM